MLLVLPFPLVAVVVWVFAIIVCAEATIYAIMASASFKYCHIFKFLMFENKRLHYSLEPCR